MPVNTLRRRAMNKHPIIKVYDHEKKGFVIPCEVGPYEDLDVMYADGKWYWLGGNEVDPERYSIDVYDYEEWTDIKEKAPEPYQKVLCYCPGDKDEPYVVDFLCDNGYWDWCTDPDTGKCVLTHWKKLPELPKE